MMEAVESAYGLVGRDAVLRTVDVLLDEAHAGHGRLLMITGEPGMGKSAVLLAAAELAVARQVAVRRGQCAAEPGAPPLWPWTQVLRSIASNLEHVDPWLVGHLVAPVGENRTVDADLGFRLFEAVATALEQQAVVDPLLVVIDDLQWADERSVGLLGFLSRRLATGRVLLLGAYRDTETSAALTSLAARAETFPLFGLDQPAVAELITRIHGTRPPSDIADQVHRRTGGNPLFVRELSRLALARGGWRSPGVDVGDDVPDSIVATLLERLARLPDRCRAMLDTAAVVGGTASAKVLGRVLDQTVDEVRAAATEAALARVLRAEPDERGWSFVHDLYREVLLGQLAPSRRAVLHQMVGEAIESLGTLDGEPLPAGRLAAHFLASGPGGREKAGRYARLAATEATHRLGHPEAVRYLELALQLADDARDATVRTELGLELGSARRRAGDRKGAAECFRRVATSAGIDPVSQATAVIELAGLEVRSGASVDENLALLRRALDRLDATVAADPPNPPNPPDLALRARLCATLARELVHVDAAGVRTKDTEPTALADRAVQLAERSGDRRALAIALLARQDASWAPGTAEARLPIIARLIEAAESAQDADLVAEGLLLRSAALIELGDPAGVGELRRFVEQADHLGHARGHWAALSRRATLACLRGELDRAAALAAEALEFGRAIGVPDAAGCHGTTMVSLAIQGRPAEFELPPTDDPVAPLVPLLTALSQPEIDHRAEVQAVPLTALTRSYDLESRVAAAPAFARWGSDEQVRDLDRELRPYVGLHAVVGGCAAHYGPVDYYLGLLAVKMDDRPRAAEHFERARELAEGLGALGWANLAGRAAAGLQDSAASDAVWLRQGATWLLRFAGTEVHLPAVKGLRDLAILIAAPGSEVHVNTLIGRTAPALGADAVLDDEARRRYRRRIETLQEEIERADCDGDAATSRRASVELEALVRELAAATGLGGRSRRLGDEVERARKTVSARVHDALERIGAVHPILADHLERSVSLGVRCSYRPAEPIAWQVSSS